MPGLVRAVRGPWSGDPWVCWSDSVGRTPTRYAPARTPRAGASLSAPVAQVEERRSTKPMVRGSSPRGCTRARSLTSQCDTNAPVAQLDRALASGASGGGSSPPGCIGPRSEEDEPWGCDSHPSRCESGRSTHDAARRAEVGLQPRSIRFESEQRLSRGMAQSGQRGCFGSIRSQVRILLPRFTIAIPLPGECGWVPRWAFEARVSWVRFPAPRWRTAATHPGVARAASSASSSPRSCSRSATDSARVSIFTGCSR